MKFRKSIISEHDQPVHPVLNHLSEIIQQTLCDKQEGKRYHEKKCLYRKCSQCGVNNFNTYKQEDDQTDSAPLIRWEKFEYVVSGKDGTGKDKKDCK